jgi:uncharacterized membrane protein (DUF2068 family)
MTNKRFLLPIILLQFIPIVLFPLETLQSGITVVGVVILLFALLGYGLWRGRTWGLYMSIFIQGLNIIIRIMMFFPHVVSEQGVWDITYLVINIVAMSLSGWFLLRLDRPDVHSIIGV